jgi:hypothetical protein
MSKFLKLVNKVLTEDIGGENQGPAPTSQSPIGTGNNVLPEPTQVSDSSSALPDEKDVNGIDLIKYKTLLKSLQDSLTKSAKNDDERYQLSKLDIDDKNTKEELQPIEDVLMGYLNDEEVPKNTNWSDE